MKTPNTFIIAITVFTLFFSCKQKAVYNPPPTELSEDERHQRREDWIKLIHRAAPDVDWKLINEENFVHAHKAAQSLKLSKQTTPLGVSAESFAGGLLLGSWYERGSTNNAGSVIATDYYPATDEIYTVSSGGTSGGGLFRSNSNGSNWTALNNTTLLGNKVLKLVPLASGKRIIGSIGKNIYFSDNEGATWAPSVGISYPIDWGGNFIQDIVKLNDENHTLYALVHGWNPSPWEARFWLYMSVDKGLTWSKIHTFNHSDAAMCSLWQPYNSTECYILDDNGTSRTLYRLDGSATLTTMVASTGLPAAGNYSASKLKGYKLGPTLVFYALLNKNKLYRSTDNGINWTLQSTLPSEAWSMGIEVSLSDPNKVFFGNVEAFRSTDAGVTFTKVNTWGEYYANVATKLHADMMDIAFFRKADNTEFALINNHGGMSYSTDFLVNNSNIGLLGLNVSQYYDVRTSPNNPNLIMAGTQDQGLQRTSSGNNTLPSTLQQVISGDYGFGQFTKNGAGYFTVYPGGWVTFYNNPLSGGHVSSWQMLGSNKSNYGWISPTSQTANSATNHEIFIGGGSTTATTGSYLIKLAYNGSTIVPTQYPYNFRANAGGSSNISAIATTQADTNRIYVATDNGNFFRSLDKGVNWSKSASTVAPGFWVYGSSILPSKTNSAIVYLAGSGYSNAGMFKSTDGGVTFTAVGTGLPQTTVHGICFNPNESQIYAATEAGPYMYVVSTNQWYSMMGTSAVLEQYYSVEYVNATNTIRFGTYGRGMWDFVVSNPSMPVDLLLFNVKTTDNQTVTIDWETASEYNNSYFTIEKSTDAIMFKPIDKIISQGNSTTKQTYQTRDLMPAIGINYYRLQQTDKNGKVTYSQTVKVKINTKTIWSLSPNPLPQGRPLNIKMPANAQQVSLLLYDLSGKLVRNLPINGQGLIYINNLPSGVYYYNFLSKNEITVQGKLVVF